MEEAKSIEAGGLGIRQLCLLAGSHGKHHEIFQLSWYFGAALAFPFELQCVGYAHHGGIVAAYPAVEHPLGFVQFGCLEIGGRRRRTKRDVCQRFLRTSCVAREIIALVEARCSGRQRNARYAHIANDARQVRFAEKRLKFAPQTRTAIARTPVLREPGAPMLSTEHPRNEVLV